MHLLGIGTVIAVTLFAVSWAVCVRVNNYSFLDVVWSFSIGILATVYALLGSGYAPRRLLFAAVGLLWSVRLGGYILVRVWRHHPTEDARYRTFREQWPGPARFLAFFELQAVVAVIFSLPFLLAMQNPAPSLGVSEIGGLLLAAVATLAEATADYQAQRFKRTAGNAGKIMNVGLWRYSRHPNYFFESLVWWGFFLAALGSPYGWVTVACPVLMLFFLLRVTGIPLTEKHSLETRGDAYREYQRTTSRFFPWFPGR